MWECWWLTVQARKVFVCWWQLSHIAGVDKSRVRLPLRVAPLPAAWSSLSLKMQGFLTRLLHKHDMPKHIRGRTDTVLKAGLSAKHCFQCQTVQIQYNDRSARGRCKVAVAFVWTP